MASRRQKASRRRKQPLTRCSTWRLSHPEYFATLGVPVLRGRTFTDRDREDAPPVVVVSQSAAQHYWPGDDPLGKRLIMGADPDRVVTVVGVVPDTRYRDLREARPSIYFPLDQSFFPFAPTSLAIRTDSRSWPSVSDIRRVIGETAPAWPWSASRRSGRSSRDRWRSRE